MSSNPNFDAGAKLASLVGSGGGSVDLTPVTDGINALNTGQGAIMQAIGGIDTAVAAVGDMPTTLATMDGKLDAIQVITQTHSDNFTEFVAGILGA